MLSSNSLEDDDGQGGGIFNNGYRGLASSRIVRSVLRDNHAYYGGGAIYNYGELGTANVLIANSVLCGNGVYSNEHWYSDAGGAVYNAIGTLQIFNSAISSNLAPYRGGGIYNGSPPQGGAAGVTSVEIFGSTLDGNAAQYGNGIFNLGLVEGTAIVKIVNSTLCGNSGTNNNFDVDIYSRGPSYTPYGGIAVLQVVNSTLSGTSATSSIPHCNIYNVAVAASNAMLMVASTVLDTGISGVSITNDSGVVTSLGYNLSSDDGGGFLTATGDQINTDPMLDPAGLQDNGGPTLTIALQCGSPAIDQGKNFSGSATDQRGDGFVRTFDDPAVPNAPGGDGTDIGAFEVQTHCNRPPIAKCKNVTVSAGPNCMASASIDDGSYDPDTGDTIILSQSPAGPYGLGTTSVTLTVTDNHGATNSCSATVEVVDTTSPVPTVASLPVVSAQCSATLIAPTATDNCAGLISATTSDPTTYNSQGSFTVHWIYNDGNGNSVTQLQTVVIKDTVPPSIICPANVVTDAVSPSGVNVTFPAPITSDNCSVASVTSSRASGSLFAIGTTTVTNQVVDEAGNTSTCTFTVKVKNAREQIIDLITLVNGLPIRSDIKIALDVKLLTALVAIDINKKPIGCAQLKDFIALAAAQNGKKLTAAQANLLIAEATRICAVLGCQ